MSQFTIGDPWQCRNAFAKLSEKEPALGLIVADCAQVARHDEKALGFKTDLQTPAPEQAANEQDLERLLQLVREINRLLIKRLLQENELRTRAES